MQHTVALDSRATRTTSIGTRSAARAAVSLQHRCRSHARHCEADGLSFCTQQLLPPPLRGVRHQWHAAAVTLPSRLSRPSAAAAAAAAAAAVAAAASSSRSCSSGSGSSARPAAAPHAPHGGAQRSTKLSMSRTVSPLTVKRDAHARTNDARSGNSADRPARACCIMRLAAAGSTGAAASARKLEASRESVTTCSRRDATETLAPACD
eukprot:TRINITY_DN18051_c0_g1_i2.p1 TRINITY_DN18051_c0_g1~~TRINITY_DN18051_c0_g1_i2.p1  ORF type:complete len:236 (-),score=70.39 TRINITY_DN18051_c0_g1_i2:48-671(-)